jgi:hypothetical protein
MRRSTLRSGRVARVAAVAVVSMCLAAYSCDGSVGYKPDFLPVTFTVDSTGHISVSASKIIVTPIGAFELNGGAGHNFQVPRKGVLAVIRHLGGAGRLVENAYKLSVPGNHTVKAELNDQSLTLVHNGRVDVDATRVPHDRTVQLKFSDVSQKSKAPTIDPTLPGGSCEAATARGSVDMKVPEISAGDSVSDTAVKLREACLTVQFAAVQSSADEGSVASVRIPTSDPAAPPVVLPAQDGNGPHPGDQVRVSLRTPATVYVAAPPLPPPPSDSPTPSPSPSVSDPGTSVTSPPPDTDGGSAAPGTDVVASRNAPVHDAPGADAPEVSQVMTGGLYHAECYTRQEPVTVDGSTSDVWVRLSLSSGGQGWVTALALQGGDTAGVTNQC